jgi:hypothetical protein
VRSDRLYELGDVEAGEASGRLRPAHLDAGDTCHPRPLPGCSLQLLQVASAAFGDELHGAVVAVLHPSIKAQRLGLADHEEAEADSLDIASDQAVKAL